MIRLRQPLMVQWIRYRKLKYWQKGFMAALNGTYRRMEYFILEQGNPLVPHRHSRYLLETFLHGFSIKIYLQELVLMVKSH